ncbi:MAG: hypothetical protein GF372_00810 [Candidatus Marinimicrobia bacterium]|nr:hypothetical protein [Candidatus Neomarinimicrobiota bacterium]
MKYYPPILAILIPILYSCINPITDSTDFSKYKIAFIALNTTNEYGIYTVSGDENDLTELYTSNNSIVGISWSIGGSGISFIEYNPAIDSAYIYILKNSGLKRIVSVQGNIADISWSTRSDFLAFNSNHSGYNNIYRVQLKDFSNNPVNNHEIEGISDSERNDTLSVYSPDFYSSKIAFVRFENNKSELCILNPWTKDVEYLTDGQFLDIGQPNWSPDAESIVFSAKKYNEDNYDLYVIYSDGSGLRQLTNSNSDEISPIWSEKADWIAFKKENEMHIITSNGEYERYLNACNPHPGGSDWSMDGDILGFTFNSEIYFANIYTNNIVDIDTKNLKLINNGLTFSPIVSD